ncbi:Bbp19 family protein [Janthinobacterium sp. CG_S6]|uniref:Bbp19 family protein n=1 Tax=Janthinobacterium sp. CG_S6 TaxID=3071707 RepID=UPI002E08B12F|nr:hypothetical protein [Janthinobacterium sp. CG_S6]
MSNPTPQDYAAIFEDDRRGAAILEHLTRIFASKVYVPGGHEADRETCYRAGKRDVIEFIVTQCNRAHGVDANEGDQS